MVQCNDGYLNVSSYSREQVIGKQVDGLFQPQDANIVRELGIYQHEVPTEALAQTADGTLIPVEILCQHTEDANLKVFALRDITHQKRRVAQVRFDDRIRTIGIMAAGIAHEINNPLTYGLAHLEMAQEMLTKSQAGLIERIDQTELLGNVNESLSASRRVARIVRSISTLSRGTSSHALELAAIPASSVVATVLDIAGSRIQQQANVLIDVDEETFLFADEASLAQILLNVILNANDAFAERSPTHNRIRVFLANPTKNSLEICVQDNGIGIDPTILSHIFEPFFSTKTARKGMGIGLHVRRELAREMNGDIIVESTVGKGTTVRIQIPIPSPLSTATLPLSQAPVGNRQPIGPELVTPLRILVVDDQVEICRILQRMLSDYELVTTLRGSDAIQRCLDASWDVILCDLMMPGISGQDVFETVIAARPEMATRFVFMTGGAHLIELIDFLDEVPNHCLHKPFRIADVHAALIDAARISGRIPVQPKARSEYPA